MFEANKYIKNMGKDIETGFDVRALGRQRKSEFSNSINVVMWLDVALFVALKGLQNERDQFPSHFGAWHPVRKVDLASWRMELMAG